MERLWKKKSQDEIKEKLFGALKKNVNFHEKNILGVPGSYLDEKVFSQDASFLSDAPFISTMIQNPNHIGCHTLGKSENFFKGTQEIEREVIEICAVDIMKGKSYQQDGYIASGGTEANIQALWIYRNYFKEKFGVENGEICLVCSEDSHYSVDKGANLLSIDIFKVKVNEDSRQLLDGSIQATLAEAQKRGKNYFIILANMMTTMYGSIDEVDKYIAALDQIDATFKIHIDAAFGGFYFPFTEENNKLNFSNPQVTSITLDAHKMAQAPYGTGIFLIRKGFIQYANTKEASYVEGEDYTLIGSRSGANAIAVWMILMKNGPYGWEEKIFILQKRTQWVCDKLSALEIEFYRHPKSNIVTIRSQYITESIAKEFGLVPDNHHKPKWYKIVVMDHVKIEKLIPLIQKIQQD